MCGSIPGNGGPRFSLNAVTFLAETDLRPLALVVPHLRCGRAAVALERLRM
jgi:hypothetical protein